MSKGDGQKIAIKFDKPLLGEVAGNQSAFTISGMQRNPLGVGELETTTYTPNTVERYPVATLYEDDFTGVLDGVEVGVNGVVLEQGTILGYGENICPGKTYSAISQYNATWSVDKPYQGTGSWTTSGTGVPAWTFIDYGSGSAKIIRRLVLQNVAPERVNAFTFQGSNNGTDWTNVYSGNQPNSTALTTHDFENSIAYRYYRVYVTSQHASSRVGFTHIRQYEIEEFPGGYIELGTYTTITPADTLPATPRLKWTEDLPISTSITAEYAVSQDALTTPITWTAINNADLLTIPDPATGYFLWLKYTLATTDIAVTPTLLSVWLEEAEAPPDTILLSFDTHNRFNDVEGDITVAYNQSLGTLAGTRPVESFSVDFTPADLEPTPIDEHTVTAGIDLTVDLITLDFTDTYTKHTATAGVDLTVALIDIDDINP